VRHRLQLQRLQLPVPVISLGELRKLAGITQGQIAGLMRIAPERVEDIESLDLELLDVDQLLQYTTALGMALTVTVDLMPGATRELISTRGKVSDMKREQEIASLKLGGQHTSETHGLAGAGASAPTLAELGQQLIDGSNAIRDTQPPGAGELPQTIDADFEDLPEGSTGGLLDQVSSVDENAG
jgi:transcriptional regulator with XRE-family HTH domain